MNTKMLLLFISIGTCLAGNAVAPTLHKYRVYCQTEQANVYVWQDAIDPQPTTCPNDPNHTINLDSICIIDEVASNNFKLQQEEVMTGGHYCTETYTHAINAGLNVITSAQISWPIDVSLIALKFNTTIDHESDLLRIYEKTDVGKITADVNSGSVVIFVDQATINAVAIGYYIHLDDGVNIDDLGRVIAIDVINNTITVENAAINSFLVSQNTVVRLFKKIVEQYEIGAAGKYNLFENRSVAHYIPANTILYIDYKNKSNEAKKLIFECEYLY